MSLAIWSNNGSQVAFANEGRPEIYHYGNEEPMETPFENIKCVEYDPGSHRKTLKLLRQDAVDQDGCGGYYFHKTKGVWHCMGKIIYANIPDQGNVKLFIEPRVNSLATNKRDALEHMGYVKKMGKGTGTLMKGVCTIVPVAAK